MTIWDIIGAIFGLAIIGAWYAETYLDTTLANNSRMITPHMNKSEKSQAIMRPLVGSCFFICSLGNMSHKLGLHYYITGFLIIFGLLCLLVGIVWRFSSLPVPRWADARYQYMKRHNLLDENGDPLPQSQWPDSEITPAEDHEETEP